MGKKEKGEERWSRVREQVSRCGARISRVIPVCAESWGLLP